MIPKHGREEEIVYLKNDFTLLWGTSRVAMEMIEKHPWEEHEDEKSVWHDSVTFSFPVYFFRF